VVAAGDLPDIEDEPLIAPAFVELLFIEEPLVDDIFAPILTACDLHIGE
jgi:hypothetical protein